MQLLTLAASVIGIEVDELLEHLKRNAMAWSAVAFFALVGVIFLLVGLNAWLASLWGPIVAPLVIGAVGIVVAFIIWAVVAIVDSIERRQAAERRASADKTALMTTAALTALPLVLKSDIMRKVGIPVGGALAAAYLLSKPTGSRHGEANGDDAE